MSVPETRCHGRVELVPFVAAKVGARCEGYDLVCQVVALVLSDVGQHWD